MGRNRILRLAVFLVTSSSAFSLVPAHAGPSGWDYDLTKRCAKTTNSSVANYYEDTTQCGVDNKNWTLVVQSENDFDASCPGPKNQSFPINQAGSPVTLSWLPHVSDLGNNWAVNMKIDQVSNPNPCGDDHFTFFSMMDTIDHHGGPLPAPQNLWSHHRIYYNHYASSPADQSRLVLGAQFFYDGKSRAIEIMPSTLNWADGYGTPYDGVLVYQNLDHLEYVQLDGAYWGHSMTPGQEKEFTVDWGSILNQVINRGLLKSIDGESVTQGVYVATEVRGRAIADMWHTNFRVASP